MERILIVANGNYIEQIRGIMEEHHTQYGKFLKRPENRHLLDCIMSYESEKLKDNNMQTHLYWLLNGIHDFPICDAPGCSNPITRNVANAFTGYDRRACSCRCAKQTDHYKEAYRRSLIENYGCDHPMHSQEIKDKVRNTTERRWGGIGFASREIRDKYEQVCMERFGVANGGGSEQALKKILGTKLKRYNHPYFVFPIGSQGMVSKGEKEVLEYVKSIYPGTIVENDRTQMEPNSENGWIENHELDIWLPDIKVAIEYNGDYWHSIGKNGASDEFKRIQCESKGIRLVVVKECDWSGNQGLCMEQIASIVNRDNDIGKLRN